ncbi:MAG: HNH endonuclease signature motif containing protein [Bacteroidales bacterium]
MIKRTNISKKLKKKLIQEAGNKCANPGCSSLFTNIHHITRWAVYQVHDESEMIAVCPNCHYAIHHGQIKVTDEVIHEWKKIYRVSKNLKSHLYIEPDSQTDILLGLCSFSNPEGMFLFNLSQYIYLNFRIINKETIVLNLSMASLDGTEVIKVTDNYISVLNTSLVEYQEVPGHIIVIAHNIFNFVPEWMVALMQKVEPVYGSISKFPILEIQVIKPGLVKVLGAWINNKNGIIITPNSISFLKPGLTSPIGFMCQQGTRFKCRGIINNTLFGFQ